VHTVIFFNLCSCYERVGVKWASSAKSPNTYRLVYDILNTLAHYKLGSRQTDKLNIYMYYALIKRVVKNVSHLAILRRSHIIKNPIDNVRTVQ